VSDHAEVDECLSRKQRSAWAVLSGGDRLTGAAGRSIRGDFERRRSHFAHCRSGVLYVSADGYPRGMRRTGAPPGTVVPTIVVLLLFVGIQLVGWLVVGGPVGRIVAFVVGGSLAFLHRRWITGRWEVHDPKRAAAMSPRVRRTLFMQLSGLTVVSLVILGALVWGLGVRSVPVLSAVLLLVTLPTTIWLSLRDARKQRHEPQPASPPDLLFGA